MFYCSCCKLGNVRKIEETLPDFLCGRGTMAVGCNPRLELNGFKIIVYISMVFRK